MTVLHSSNLNIVPLNITSFKSSIIQEKTFPQIPPEIVQRSQRRDFDLPKTVDCFYNIYIQSFDRKIITKKRITRIH